MASCDWIRECVGDDVKEKRVVVATSLLPKSKQRLVEAAKNRDVPVSVLVRDLMNFAIKQGFNL